MTSLAVPRDETQSAPAWAVVLVLLVLIAVLPCEHAVERLLRVPFYGSGRSYNAYVLTGAEVLRALAAGLLADAFGIGRVMALGLVAWCVLVTATGLVNGRLDLALIDLSSALALGPFGIVSWVVIGSCLPPSRRALPLAIVVVASYLSIYATPYLARLAVGIGPHGDPTPMRAFQACLLASIGAFVVLVWLVFRPAPSRSVRGTMSRGMTAACDGLVQFLGNRRVWSIFALFAISEFTFEIGYRRIGPFLAHEGGFASMTSGVVAYYPLLAVAIGDVGAAIASDGVLARARSLAAARRPFVVAGFLLAAGMGLLPLLPWDDLVAMAWIAGLGMGLQIVLGVIVLDMTPPRHLGTLAGLLIATGDLARLLVGKIALAVYAPAHSFAPILVIGGIVSLVGAALAAWSLREIAPLETAAT